MSVDKSPDSTGRHSLNPHSTVFEQLDNLNTKMNLMVSQLTDIAIEQKSQSTRIKVIEDRHVIRGTRSHTLKVAAVGAGLGTTIASAVSLMIVLL